MYRALSTFAAMFATASLFANPAVLAPNAILPAEVIAVKGHCEALVGSGVVVRTTSDGKSFTFGIIPAISFLTIQEIC